MMREGGGGGGDAIIHLERREDGGGTLKGILMEYNLIPVVVVDRGEGGFVLVCALMRSSVKYQQNANTIISKKRKCIFVFNSF